MLLATHCLREPQSNLVFRLQTQHYIPNKARQRDNMAYDNNKPTLLTLPGEIKNRIFREVITDKYVYMVEFDERRLEPEKVRINLPALMRTCRTLRNEVGSVFYGENPFNFDISRHASRKLECFQRATAPFTKYITDVQAVLRTGNGYILVEVMHIKNRIEVELCVDAWDGTHPCVCHLAWEKVIEPSLKDFDRSGGSLVLAVLDRMRQTAKENERGPVLECDGCDDFGWDLEN